MIVYHVVTDRPMEKGQVILFDSEHHSGVYRRVMEKKPLADEILAHPERFDGELEHHTAVALRELAMEEVRQNEFPQYPSRMACLYVSRTLEEARRWAEFFVSLGRPVYSIVKFRVDGSFFEGDACLCFDGTADQAQNLALARRYWNRKVNGEPPVTELLVGGRLEVLEIVEEICGNIPKS